MAAQEDPSRHRLLIIETDDLIRDLIVRWLTEAGHAVETDVDDPQMRAVALVVVDVPDPAQASTALARIAARYGAPILAMSGRFSRSSAAIEGAARRLGVARVLPKPFTGEELLAAVLACLGGH